MGIKQTCHIMRGHDRSRLAPPKTELSFTLSPCVTEIDLSMFDRLTAVFNADPFAVDDEHGGPTAEKQTVGEKPAPKFELKVECSSVDASLRLVLGCFILLICILTWFPMLSVDSR